MKISVIGTGYVGLVSGVCFADIGHDVVCVDNDREKIEKIRAGVPPIYEKGLEDLLNDVIGSRLSVTDDLDHAVRNTDVTFIAVGTPFDGTSIDLSYIEAVAAEIGRSLAAKNSYHVVVVKSTVVPGTTDTAVRDILERESGLRAGADFGLGMNPEFLTEGVAIRDFMEPDRIVVGGIDSRSQDVLADVYAAFENVPVVRTNTRTAEMIKYASNALLATMISFSNEIANLGAEIGGIDSVDVMNGVHLSHYLSPALPDGSRLRAPIASFLEAGCGFGGSCLPKDVKALVAQGEAAGLQMGLLKEVIRVNQQQPQRVVDILQKNVPTLNGKRVGVLGLAFKPDTDDLRETPAVPIVEKLLAAGASVVAYDPIAMPEARRHLSSIPMDFADSLDDVVASADAIVLITRWDEFSALPDVLAKHGRQTPVIDGRRMLDKTAISNYDGIGLG